VKPGLAESVEQVILQAMAKEPEDRYSSARQAKHALINQAHLSGRELPPYLQKRQFTGQIPVLDPTEIAADDVPEQFPPRADTPKPRKTRAEPKPADPGATGQKTMLTAALIVAASAAAIIVAVLMLRYC
jgi:hypothetical protein